MHIKTYQSTDLAGALKAARDELGPDALVLATNEVSGRMGLTRVEITVAVDPGATATPVRPRLDTVVGDVIRPTPAATSYSDATRRPTAIPAAEKQQRRAGRPRIHPALRPAFHALVESGLSSDLAERFAGIAARGLPAEIDHGTLEKAAARGLAELVPFAAPPWDCDTVMLVGPPGAGKTTAAAKLAARQVQAGHREVVFVQADNERIGAHEEARIYCRHLDVRFVAVDAPEDLEPVLRRRRADSIVIVDTPGVGAADEVRLDRLCRLGERLPEGSASLLLPNGLQRDEARRVIERFAPVGPGHAALSRVDDGIRIGELVSAVASTRMPLAYITDGHRVPQDIHAADSHRLAALMFGSSETPETLTSPPLAQETSR